ncbi:MAG: DegT/DnrJ/EryC1/StrS family aminotransferase [Alphaproteobacteria bacterium]|nr:MAG: DegT/DnrJ/EryC1/StrS family aminotransferase [Alphaproteobacteria bacterium]
MTDFIAVNEPLLTGNEEKYLVECIRTGWISSEGPFIAQFESEFSARMGRQQGVAVMNGSVALDLAVGALGIGPGDEVVMPSHTIISCPSAVYRAGATPVVVDCDPLTYNSTAEAMEAAITPRTKAIMVVHIFGLPVDMDPVLALAKKHDLKIIEDAAEMHGQTYKGRPCGSFGDISTFSFYPNKHITTGEGGMVVTDDPTLADRCRTLRNLAFKPEQRFVHDELGWNFRMTNRQAALGVAQLERLDEFVGRKRAMGQRYTEMLKDVEGIQLPVTSTNYADNIYWVYPIVIDEAMGFDGREMSARLQKIGVGSRPFFWPIHKQPVFLKAGLFATDSHPVAERIGKQGFYIPSGMAITEDQMDRVVDAVKQAVRG